MKQMRLGVILLALLLAGMAMVPMVSAGALSNESEFGMKYLQTAPVTENLKKTIAEDPTGIFSTVSEYNLVTVNSEAFINDADTTKHVTFNIMDKEYQIYLKSVSTPIDKNVKIVIKTPNGEKSTDLPKIKTYSGEIIGDEKGTALFTVSDNVLLGKISIGNKTYYIDQCGISENGKIIHILYNSANEIKSGSPRTFDIVIRDEISRKSTTEIPYADISSNSTRRETLQTRPQSTTRSLTSIGLLAVYDTQFSNSYPNPTAEISNMISQVNNAFAPADVSLSITGYYQDSTLTGTIAYPLLCDFRTNYQDERDQTNSDLAFLFTGKQLGNDVGGAFQYSNGNPSNAYALAQMVSDGGVFSGSSYQREVLITHEIGHNFGADHENSSSSPTWARAYHWVDWLIYNKYTAMWSLWQGNDGQIEFSNSNNHGDSTHNNIQRIRDTKATVAAYQ
jgi:hypothetical protein